MKTRAILSTNQIRNWNQSWLGHTCFSALQAVCVILLCQNSRCFCSAWPLCLLGFGTAICYGELLIRMQQRAGISLYLQAFLNTRWLYSFTQVKKALELYEQLRQRMGVVVIGPSGSGKSTIWKLLRLALGKVGQTVKHYTMNPKAMPRTQVGVMSKRNLLSNSIVALLIVVN